jgi:type IV secretory pathway VirB10-like protein
MARHETLASVCALLLWMGGCPKRQETKSLVVYVPAQAPAAARPAEKSQVLVIEEPASPPEPQETPTAPTPEPTPPNRPRRPANAEPPETSPQEAPETPPAEVPALEPRETAAQETALRQEVQRLQEDVRRRMARLNQAPLSPNERKTLEDARTFLTQSTHAFESSDLQRALNLAKKASLLVAALE